MKHQIDPKIDCVFKAILGSEKNKNLLIHFINSILELKGNKKIIDVDILNPYNEREFTDDKLSVVDVKAKDRKGNFYQIEVQLAIHIGLTNRILYSWSSIYHSQLGKGDDFDLLKPVISIWLMNQTLFEDANSYHLPFHILNKKHRIELNNHLSIHIIQLPLWQRPDKKLKDKDRWLYLFKEGKQIDTDNPPEPLQTQEMKQAMNVMKQFSENQKDYLLYQSRLEGLSVIATWKAHIEKAECAKEAAIKEKEEAIAAAEEKAAAAEEKAAKKVQKALKIAESEAKIKNKAVLKLKQMKNEYKKLLQKLNHNGSV